MTSEALPGSPDFGIPEGQGTDLVRTYSHRPDLQRITRTDVPVCGNDSSPHGNKRTESKHVTTLVRSTLTRFLTPAGPTNRRALGSAPRTRLDISRACCLRPQTLTRHPRLAGEQQEAAPLARNVPSLHSKSGSSFSCFLGDLHCGVHGPSVRRTDMRRTMPPAKRCFTSIHGERLGGARLGQNPDLCSTWFSSPCTCRAKRRARLP